MNPQLWLLPPVAALVGWGTNRLAIRLLFRPLRPLRIPGTSWTLQGLLPRRRADIARLLGETVEKELFSGGDFLRPLGNAQLREPFLAEVEAAAARSLHRRLPGLVPGPLRRAAATYLGKEVRAEAEEVFDEMLGSLKDRLDHSNSVRDRVEERLQSLDLEELEELVLRVAGRELRHIEALGGVVGFLVGLLQVLGVLLSSQ